MAAENKYRIVQCEDGFYIARPLKNGTISSDARKISDGEILSLFEAYLHEYCKRNVTNYMEVKRGDAVAFEAKIFPGD